ncbi:MAG: riboflavin synthase [Planctomycetaceae bacterium]
MFTGLIEGQGKVVAIEPEGAGVLLSIEPPADLNDGAHTEVALGESVAINGCCLTVVSFDENTWSFQAGSETLSRTNLGRLQAGDVVNIERALRANARLGGHFVQGHVDDTGTVAKIDREGEWVFMWFKVPPRLTRQMVSKGSICVDGISLTLVEVSDDEFSVALIPHTLEVTTLGQRQPGDMVNIETDILGKYIEKLVAPSS